MHKLFKFGFSINILNIIFFELRNDFGSCHSSCRNSRLLSCFRKLFSFVLVCWRFMCAWLSMRHH